MSDPWFKFYARDWRGDQALRAVSIAARGFWMECLCIMYEAKPRGHLLLNGAPVEDGALARMAGVSVDEVRFLMEELRQAGVFSVTRKGVIFSRRMTKDHARAQKGKAAANKRWNAPDEATPQAPDTKQKSGAPIRLPIREPITQKPETREPKGSLLREKPPNRFEEFWQSYPHRNGAKKGRAKAEASYARHVKAGSSEAEILQGAIRYARDRQVLEGYAKDPTTWLNAKGWQDDIEPAKHTPSQAPPNETADDKVRRLVANFGK